MGDGIDVIVNAQSVSFRISNEILFPSGQADLALTGSDVLDRLANVLARNPYPLSIEGHTDIIPIQNDRFASNWELATARATSVVRYLSRHGIASDRMRAVGYAHTRPLTTNDTPQGRSTNRRVELIMDIPPAR
nr:OmpA family protein [Verticiella sp. GG226]